MEISREYNGDPAKGNLRFFSEALELSVQLLHVGHGEERDFIDDEDPYIPPFCSHAIINDSLIHVSPTVVYGSASEQCADDPVVEVKKKDLSVNGIPAL